MTGLMINDGPPKVKIPKWTKKRYFLPCHDGVGAIKPGLPKFSQAEDIIDKERLLTTSKIVIEQAW